MQVGFEAVPSFDEIWVENAFFTCRSGYPGKGRSEVLACPVVSHGRRERSAEPIKDKTTVGVTNYGWKLPTYPGMATLTHRRRLTFHPRSASPSRPQFRSRGAAEPVP